MLYENKAGTQTGQNRRRKMLHRFIVDLNSNDC